MYGLSTSGEIKLQFTPFWGGGKQGWSDSVRVGIIKSHNFFVLHSILMKLHIRTWLIESFSTIFWTWWCAVEKLRFTPFHALCQLKREEALFPPLGRIVRFRVRYGEKTACRFWGWAKFGERATLRLRKSSTSHLF